MFALKIILSALIIAIVSEVSKRSPFMGAVVASLPLVSLLAIIWIYVETKNTKAIADFSNDMIWMLFPSISFFVILPQALKMKISFWLAIGVSLFITAVCYAALILFKRYIH